MTIPVGAACYFCLGEEADEEGMPLLRDCSCRGDSAGFAHLSCLTKFAEQKSKQAGDGDVGAFAKPWEICNNCKQPFQGQLAMDLASALVSFSEVTYGHAGNNKWDKMKVMAALRLKIMALYHIVELAVMHGADNTNEAVKVEMILLINHLLDTVKQAKKDLNMSRWIHMPHDSQEYRYYKIVSGNYEAYAYSRLGQMLISDTSEEGFNIMITHYKKAHAICKLVGMKDDAQQIDATILMLTAEHQAINAGDASSSTAKKSGSEFVKNEYERRLNSFGMNSEVTIRSGLNYAVLLRIANRLIEAERLVTKFTIISRQVHGPNHKTTIRADELLKEIKERYIFVFPERQMFQALRYENDGEICVVIGPVANPRNLEDERVFHVNSHLVIPRKGCAVICHGLVSASYLNGELGEVRDAKFDGAGIRSGVSFEKKGVKSALVKPENLRIAFELPIEKE